MSAENLIIETDGDLLLIFTRRIPKKDATAGDGVLRKRKTPHDASNKVTMLVSSKHMTSASSVFKTMIENKINKGFKTGTEGKVGLLLPREDPAVFVIIANVIHGRNKTVAQKVDFHLLVSLAIVTKIYKLQECLRFAGITWINNRHNELSGQLTDWAPGCGNRAFSIIYVLWVFGMRDEFMLYTKSAILHSNGDFEVPLPTGPHPVTDIIAAIQEARLQAFNDLFTALSSFHMRGTKLISCCQTTPKDTCDFMTAGSFMRSCARHIAWPLPNPPYTGLRLKTVIESVLKTGIQSRCKESNPGSKDCINDQMFEKMIEEQIKVIESRILAVDTDLLSDEEAVRSDSEVVPSDSEVSTT